MVRRRFLLCAYPLGETSETADPVVEVTGSAWLCCTTLQTYIDTHPVEALDVTITLEED
jgi:hypothetical protein